MSLSQGADSERALILAPLGRDAAIATAILAEAGIKVLACPDLAGLADELEAGAGVAVIVEEALHVPAYQALSDWIEAQPSWSDMPIVLLASRGAGIERNPGARGHVKALGNVSFLERPFHPTTLVSMAQAALRGRRRQYEARDRIETIRAAEESLERRVVERTAQLEIANRQLAGQIAERERLESVMRHAQRLEAVGQLTSGVAHDFNNLLTVVLGNIRQMQRIEVDPTTARRLQMMAQAAERGAQLTAQMLAFSRGAKLDLRPVDLNQTVGGMQDLLRSTLGAGVHVATRLSGDLWPALIDPTQIELMILNLAINARDAMEGSGSLTIETANVRLTAPMRPEDPPAGDHVMVAVHDTGSGMTPEVLAKVFEPFFTTKEVGKGSGLGLSQVFGLAKQSGGGVRIVSAPGAGTSVEVYLPRSAEAPEIAPVVVEAAPIRHARAGKVLVVDDDAAVREVTAACLAELGYGVVEADGGDAALDRIAQSDEIELVLLDFAMPGMNGAEVARRLRAIRPGLPILFLTGYADRDSIPQAGEHDILTKPFRPEELAAKLRGVLG